MATNTSPPPLEGLRQQNVREGLGLPSLDRLVVRESTIVPAEVTAPIVLEELAEENLTGNNNVAITIPLAVTQETIVENTRDSREPARSNVFVPLDAMTNSLPENATPELRQALMDLGTLIESQNNPLYRRTETQSHTTAEALKATPTPPPLTEVKVIEQAAPTNNPAVPKLEVVPKDVYRSFTVLASWGVPEYPTIFPYSIGNLLPKSRFPKSVDTLTKKKGYYIVPWNNSFYYYKISDDFIQRSEHIFEFTIKPPTNREGFVIINKELYYVTLEDLKRGIVRKVRKLDIKSGATYADLYHLGNNRPDTSKSTSTSADTVGPGTNVDSTEGAPANIVLRPLTSAELAKAGLVVGANETDGMDLAKAANMAFEEQIESLHSFVSEEEGEEWEVSETP